MGKFKRVFPWLLILLWMMLLFYLSHQPVERSNGLSKTITKLIIEVVEKILPDRDFNFRRFNHTIRKLAHFFAYLILGVFVMIALRSYGLRGYKAIILSLLICIVYAISDEFHQLFVSGRGGQVKDIIIDSLGALTGVLIYKGFHIKIGDNICYNKHKG